jgi:hypothetical protein
MCRSGKTTRQHVAGPTAVFAIRDVALALAAGAASVMIGSWFRHLRVAG